MHAITVVIAEDMGFSKGQGWGFASYAHWLITLRGSVYRLKCHRIGKIEQLFVIPTWEVRRGLTRRAPQYDTPAGDN